MKQFGIFAVIFVSVAVFTTRTFADISFTGTCDELKVYIENVGVFDDKGFSTKRTRAGLIWCSKMSDCENFA
jgi:hypothetical protein